MLQESIPPVDEEEMSVFSAFQPRAEVAAKKAIFGLTTVSAGITVLFATAFPSAQTRTGTVLTICGCALIAALATGMVLRSVRSPWMWAVYPFLAIVVIATLDLCSADASLTAQIFLVFPVLYAGAQLKRRAAAAVCGIAIMADAVVTLAQLTVSTALIDTSFMAAALVAATILLVGAGERNDSLIAELERQAAIDPLTGLLTRRVLDSAAAAALQGAGATLGTALLLIDVDRFKQVNDVHGHPAGDAVLQQLAVILTTVNRRSDVISRIGGDELAVLLPSCSLDVAFYRAEQILLEVRAHTFDVSTCTMATQAEAPSRFSLSVSIGVAHLPTHAVDLRNLYAAADTSLYQAKTGGRDQVGPTPEPRSSPVLT
jgi:diguanylate cyclase (GGDEF)-like protein